MIIDFAFLYIGFNLEFSYALVDVLVYDSLLFVLALSYWFPARYISIDESKLAILVFKHLGAAAVASFVWIELGYAILKYGVRVSGENLNFLEYFLGWRMALGIASYVIIVSLYYLYIYYTNFQQKLLDEAELKSLVKEAELKSLKYQINPHFIFNSLNSISSLTMVDADKAREMTIKLSSYLRYTLANNEKQFNSLQDELNNAKLYIEIEKIRFSDKFEFVEEVETGCENFIVPSMILQPLIENAIKYGVYESFEKVFIKLTCVSNEEYLILRIENNFEESSSFEGEKIGLKNIKNRLKLIYHQDNLLTTKKENNLFTAKIFIPKENGRKN